MIKRKLTIIIGTLILIAAFVINKQLSSMRTPPKKSPPPPTNLLVEAITVKNDLINTPINIKGRLVARDRIELYSEVSGTLLPSGQAFKEGNSFQKGAVLLQMDNREARLSLFSAKSTFLKLLIQLLPDLKIDYPESYDTWNQYVERFSAEKSLAPLPEATSKVKNFLAARDVYNQYYSLQSQEVRLSKYTITAPFNGTVSSSAIDQGTTVRAGQKMGEFINPLSYEMEAAISLADANFVQINDSVSVTSEDISGVWSGTVSRISEHIDPNTQTLMVYVKITGAQLKEGMYLEATIFSQPIDRALTINRKLIQPGNQVFFIQNGALALQPIEVVRESESNAIIRGLKDGTQLPKEPINGAYEGMKVSIIK